MQECSVLGNASRGVDSFYVARHIVAEYLQIVSTGSSVSESWRDIPVESRGANDKRVDGSHVALCQVGNASRDLAGRVGVKGANIDTRICPCLFRSMQTRGGGLETPRVPSECLSSLH